MTFPVQEVDKVTQAFPAKVKHLMPEWSSIPEEFHNGYTPYDKLFSACFYGGLSSLKLVPKEGIDQNKAWIHLRAIMGSYEPKHEHKQAAVAYLLSQWFEHAEWVTKDGAKGSF